MNDNKKNFLDEAIKIIPLIDESEIKRRNDILFFTSMKSVVKNRGFISEKQIFWLRDLKDKQLEGFSEYSDKDDSYRD